MKKWVKIAGWTTLILGVLVLLVVVQNTLKDQVLEEPEVIISVQDDHVFLTKQQLIDQLKMEGLIFNGQKKEELDLQAIEEYVNGISQVKNTKVYSPLGVSWQIDVELRKPVVRLFNKFGESFYLDAEGQVMDVSRFHSARVVVATGEIYDRKSGESVSEIINNDSLISIRKLDDIYRISNYVCHDPLFRSLIGQLHVEKNGDFVMIPLVGDQRIIFGSGASEEEVEEKFEKLRIFYKEAIPSQGWNTYSEISLKYRDQIVCKTK